MVLLRKSINDVFDHSRVMYLSDPFSLGYLGVHFRGGSRQYDPQQWPVWGTDGNLIHSTVSLKVDVKNGDIYQDLGDMITRVFDRICIWVRTRYNHSLMKVKPMIVRDIPIVRKFPWRVPRLWIACVRIIGSIRRGQPCCSWVVTASLSLWRCANGSTNLGHFWHLNVHSWAMIIFEFDPYPHVQWIFDSWRIGPEVISDSSIEAADSTMWWLAWSESQYSSDVGNWSKLPVLGKNIFWNRWLVYLRSLEIEEQLYAWRIVGDNRCFVGFSHRVLS